MIGQTEGLEKSVKCAAPIAAAYTIGKFGADDDTFAVASSRTDRMLGIFQYTTVNPGDEVRVMMDGISRLVLGTTVTRGQLLTADANGKGTPVTSENDNAIGVALASGVSGDIIPCFVHPDLDLAGLFSGRVFETRTVTTSNTAGALTYTAAMILGGVILRDPNGAARSDVTDTAAAIVAAIPGCMAGFSFEFYVQNNASGAYTITVTAPNASVTLSGTMTIAQGNAKKFLAVITNATPGSEAVTIYSLGTVVF